jgi:hypothetical protein
MACCLQPPYADYKQPSENGRAASQHDSIVLYLTFKETHEQLAGLVGFITEREGAPILAPRKLMEIVKNLR